MACPDQPRFHVAPPDGWLNDPNGPIFYKGIWHLFYQYLPGSAKWDFGLQWGHAVSKDMVHWIHLPAALCPTPGSADQDGVFSGCACIDEETGTPVLLYTGVRQRSSPTCGPLPPAPYDLNLPIIESQLIAWPADPADPLLQIWCKGNVPLLSLPPANLDLAGWRDPFITSTPSTSSDGKYTMLLGSGFKHKGGCTLVYKSKHLHRGWEYEGMLCCGSPGPCGIMWECPLLAELQPQAQNEATARAATGTEAISVVDAAVGSEAPVTDAAAAASLPSGIERLGHECNSPDLHVPPGLEGREISFLQRQPTGSCQDDDGGTSMQSNGFACRDEHCTAAPGHPSRPSPCLTTASSSTPARLASVSQTPGSTASIQSPTANPAVLNPGPVLQHPGFCVGGQDRNLKHSFFCISPDVCTNPSIYWLGCCPTDGTFELSGALGPFKLDLGDVVYAPNLVKDPQGRTLLVAWLQERRKVGEYTYAGCLSVARVLSIDTSDLQRPRLVQQPLPELTRLRIPREADASSTWQAGADSLARKRQSGCGGPDKLEAATPPRRAGIWSMDGKPGVSPQSRQRVEAGGSRAGVVLSRQASAALATAADLTVQAPEAEPFVLQFSNSPPAGCALTRSPCSRQQSGNINGFQVAPYTGTESWDSCLHSIDRRHSAALESLDSLTSGMSKLGQAGVLLVGAGESVPVTGVAGCLLDLEISFLPVDPAEDVLQQQAAAGGREMMHGLQQPATQATAAAACIGEDAAAGLRSGLFLRSWASSQGSAALLYDWGRGALEVVFEAVEPETHQFSLAAPDVRRVGGVLQAPPRPGEPLQLRLLLDGSVLEVFTGSGEVLSTRLYRGLPGQDGAGRSEPATSGIDVISVGGTTRVTHLEAYEMSSIWDVSS